MSLTGDEKQYRDLMVWRDKVVGPVVTVLNALRIRPGFISILRIVGAFFFAAVLPLSPYIASAIFIVVLLLDLFDGALARQQGTASDRGKFIDLVTDGVVFLLFVVGLSFTGLLVEGTGLLLVAGLFLSKAFRCIEAGRSLPSDWHFRAFAGGFPNMMVGVAYVLFGLSLLSMQNYLAFLSPLIGLALLVDAAIAFRTVIKQK